MTADSDHRSCPALRPQEGDPWSPSVAEHTAHDIFFKSSKAMILKDQKFPLLIFTYKHAFSMTGSSQKPSWKDLTG